MGWGKKWCEVVNGSESNGSVSGLDGKKCGEVDGTGKAVVKSMGREKRW